jgi:hypothetical protein
MLSFAQYTNEQQKKRKREAQTSRQAPSSQADDTGKTSQPSPEPDLSPMILGIIEQMVAAKLIERPTGEWAEESTGEPNAEPNVAGIAKSLGVRIVAVHNAIMGDPAVGIQIKRMSNQNLCLGFLGVLAIVQSARRSA